MTLLLSIMMLAAFALAAGAVYLWRRGASRLQVTLMVVMVLVIIGNVALMLPPEDAHPPSQLQDPR